MTYSCSRLWMPGTRKQTSKRWAIRCWSCLCLWMMMWSTMMRFTISRKQEDYNFEVIQDEQGNMLLRKRLRLLIPSLDQQQQQLQPPHASSSSAQHQQRGSQHRNQLQQQQQRQVGYNYDHVIRVPHDLYGFPQSVMIEQTLQRYRRGEIAAEGPTASLPVDLGEDRVDEPSHKKRQASSGAAGGSRRRISDQDSDDDEDNDDEDDDYNSAIPYERRGTDYQRHERIALLKIFSSLKGTKSMERTGKWLDHSISYCEWAGVICGPRPMIPRMDDDHDDDMTRQGRQRAQDTDDSDSLVITGLDLSKQKLVGSLPSEISLFVHLRNLNLSNNAIKKSIPSDYARLTMLQHLDLSRNLLTGTLPPELGLRWTSLHSLNVFFNYLTGPLPQIVSAWTNLTLLDVSHNAISGPIPSTNSMRKAFINLQYLFLGDNQISSTLPNDLSTWTSLKVLDAGSNLLSGKIPNTLPSHLQDLNLADNNFSGRFPLNLLRLTHLQTLQLSHNAITGTIPVGGGQADGLPVRITDLKWSNLKNLTLLMLNNNDLVGVVLPTFFLGLQSSLRHLDISHNRLVGTIATEIGRMTSLHTIDAQGNRFGGSLPNEMLNMDRNLRLNFTNNLITGTIPSMFCGEGTANLLYREFGCDAVLCRVGTFSMDGHATLYSACRPCPPTDEGETKSPPESRILGRTSCPSVEFVHGDLDGDGRLSPREVLRMIYIDTIGTFWGNEFRPWQDMSVHECDLKGVHCNASRFIVKIDLRDATLCSDGNRRPGPIHYCLGLPPQIGEINTLEILQLAKQQFLRGTIPNQISKLTNLRVLDLSHCSSLTGSIPSEIGLLTDMKYLLISHSQIGGKIPTELFQLTKLDKLHLISNTLTGTISTTFGLLTDMREFMLSRNLLNGTIGTEIGQLTLLENFEVYYNKFSGSIPTEIANCTSLKRFDVFNNNMNGSIPDGLAEIQMLQILHLKLNSFTGTISSRFGDLNYLSWFDVSHNRVHGTIPASFGSSRTLKDFRLANNMIYDPIPATLCSNKNINSGAARQYGCDGILCPLGTFSDQGHATEDDGGCKKCPKGQTTLYLGATACLQLTGRDLLEIFYHVMGGDDWPDDSRTNWAEPGLDPCSWAGITCDDDGEVTGISFPLTGASKP